MFSQIKRFFRGHIARRPDVFIAGFQKCGTTALYEWLHASPDLGRGSFKEIDVLAEHPDRLTDYLAEFPSRLSAKRTLCASHQIGYVPHGPETLVKHFPAGRVILMVRNPVERAVSRYAHNQRKISSKIDRKIELGLEELVRLELRHYRSFGGDLGVRDIFEFGSRYTTYGLPVGRGVFLPYVDAFKKSGLRLFVTSLELLTREFETEFGRICEFMELPIPPGVSPEKHNANPNSTTASDEIKNVLDDLRSFYAPFNSRLEDLVGKRLFFD